MVTIITLALEPRQMTIECRLNAIVDVMTSAFHRPNDHRRYKVHHLAPTSKAMSCYNNINIVMFCSRRIGPRPSRHYRARGEHSDLGRRKVTGELQRFLFTAVGERFAHGARAKIGRDVPAV